MTLKRKVCPDCGRKQGTHGQWINNQKLCAAHTGASDALLACLTTTVALLRGENRNLNKQVEVFSSFVGSVCAAAITTGKQVDALRKP